MSKAFTKDDAVEEPLVVPARAPLPAGVTNYVTARGLELLRAEFAALEAERRRLEGGGGDEAERARAIVTGRLAELGTRLGSAVVFDPRAGVQDEVRFGATVTLRAANGDERRFQIVGVDEADAAHGRVAFLAPIARAVLGRRVGDVVGVRTGRGEEELELVAIDYGA